MWSSQYSGTQRFSLHKKSSDFYDFQSMQSRPAEIPEEEWSAMGTVYEEVDQIDLYVGGLAETAVTGDIAASCRSS